MGRTRVRPPRWWVAYREQVWWPRWVGRWARFWQAGLLALGWPVALWAAGSALFWLAAGTVRLVPLATAFGWLAVVCCVAAAVLPFAGVTLLYAAIFRTAPGAGARERALGTRPASGRG